MKLSILTLSTDTAKVIKADDTHKKLPSDIVQLFKKPLADNHKNAKHHKEFT